MTHWREERSRSHPPGSGCEIIIALVIGLAVAWFCHSVHWFGMLP